MERTAIRTANAERARLLAEAAAVIRALAEEMRAAIPADAKKFVESITDVKTGRRVTLEELIVRVEDAMMNGDAFVTQIYRDDLADICSEGSATFRERIDRLAIAWPTIQFRVVETTDRTKVHIYAAG